MRDTGRRGDWQDEAPRIKPPTPFDWMVARARRALYAANYRGQWAPGQRWPEELQQTYGAVVLSEAEARLKSERAYLVEQSAKQKPTNPPVSHHAAILESEAT